MTHLKKSLFLRDKDKSFNFQTFLHYDLPASIVIFLVALPLCLGIALASGAPLSAGLIAGVVGGVIVNRFSSSALGVTGPSAGLAVIVFAAIQELSFDAVLVAVVLAGIIQFILGSLGAGVIGYYFPSAVITGMLSGIGIIIFLKQIPHAMGYDKDYEGDLTFVQSDDYTTLTELQHMFNFIEPGAIVISLVCLAILLVWETKWIKQYRFRQMIHGSVVVGFAGVVINQLFIAQYPEWALNASHLVRLPVAESLNDFVNLISFPDFDQINNPAIYPVALTIAIVASIETLLCVEAVDKLDPYKRVTSNNRELRAQGIGNICSGLIGGLPMTQLIVRSSANIQSGGRTRMSAFTQGIFLLIVVLLMPKIANMIPLASLATILMFVGYKLAKPALFVRMYKVGLFHFIPFVATILGLIFSDMLTGIGIGMAFALFFILMENLQVGFDLQKQVKVNKTIITLSENVSFLNKANILRELTSLPKYSNVVIDATNAKYIDYDVYEVIQNFKVDAKHKGIKLIFQNMRGFGFLEPVKRALPITKEVQQALTPNEVLEILRAGNHRFVNSLKDNRNLLEQANQSVEGQFPVAIILSCIDSRTSAELIFDQGLGDVFSVRVAGNVVNSDILGSMEYACKVSGSKLVVVLGHTHCGAVKGACSEVKMGNLTTLLEKIHPAVVSVKSGKTAVNSIPNYPLEDKVSERNVELMVDQIRRKSKVLKELEDEGKISVVGAMFDIETGMVKFYN